LVCINQFNFADIYYPLLIMAGQEIQKQAPASLLLPFARRHESLANAGHKIRGSNPSHNQNERPNLS
jgi:hypothetical protein